MSPCAPLFSATLSSFHDIGTAPPAIIILIVTLHGGYFIDNRFNHSIWYRPRTFSRSQQSLPTSSLASVQQA